MGAGELLTAGVRTLGADLPRRFASEHASVLACDDAWLVFLLAAKSVLASSFGLKVDDEGLCGWPVRQAGVYGVVVGNNDTVAQLGAAARQWLTSIGLCDPRVVGRSAAGGRREPEVNLGLVLS
jgi:hypothetical protein